MPVQVQRPVQKALTARDASTLTSGVDRAKSGPSRVIGVPYVMQELGTYQCFHPP
jgi:hypothetical protein